MAKARTFADKMKKEKSGAACPICESARQPVKTVTPERHAVSGAWTFRTKIVVVCKCNHKEVYES
jgi:hypothetical protein